MKCLVENCLNRERDSEVGDEDNPLGLFLVISYVVKLPLCHHIVESRRGAYFPSLHSLGNDAEVGA